MSWVNKALLFACLVGTWDSSRWVVDGFRLAPVQLRQRGCHVVDDVSGTSCRSLHDLESSPDTTIRRWSNHPASFSFAKGRRSSKTVLRASSVAIPDAVKSVLETLFPAAGTVVAVQYAFALNFFLFTLLKRKLDKMLTTKGYYNAMALGTGLWATLGWRAWTLCVLYLFLGQAVTKVKFEEKEERGIAEARGGRRGAENVWGSALTGLICAAFASRGKSMFGASPALFKLGYVASIATKLSDTFASEIGKAYGKTTFLITTFERVERGTEGAVSAEGTAAAMVGGLLLALYGYSVGLISTWRGVGIATMAAFLATNVESLIGATMQGKEGLDWMTNEVVNFFNTVIGATIAIAGGKFLL